ncbi:MAG: isoprenyl transferase [Polyangiaceae bacterium UTPRO1]|jgi:undecaprenyl diphosphate synthase|nr:isoprenyl transferase [Myxococcales bacterium]OQY68693.1 MAG: isoprenyl transferase [Polyangiaceae bacterium UTPRO1]
MVEIDKERLPRHVAIIMDGNGRWATQRGLTRITGHRRGKQSVQEIVETARRLGIPYLSLYAFSTENWLRPREEVAALMRFLRHFLAAELKKMMRNGIRLLAIGNLRRLPREVQTALRQTIEDTRNNTGMTVILAVSYGAREELTEAARAIARKVRRGDIDPEDVDQDLVASHLGTAGVPDPDLLIRTSGEMRISNFLLWQIAYTEIYVTDTLWPDFRKREFLDAVAHFQRRERRFGRTGEQAERERLRAAH